MSQTNGNTEETASGNFLHLSKHPQYYIPTGDLSILVDHVQFKVHRYFFERESKFFANKLATPATPGSSLPGLDDPNAIILERVTPEQFATFLWVFYNEKYSIYEAPIDKWEIILRLSTDWSFPEVKSLSIRELEKKIMPDVKRVKMYHENKVDRNILIPRYAALIEREDPLTFEEGYDLGMETAMMIARGREEARSARQPNGARSPSTPTIHGADLYEAIRALFKITPSEGVVEAEPAHNGHNSTGSNGTATVETTTNGATAHANGNTESGSQVPETATSDEKGSEEGNGTGTPSSPKIETSTTTAADEFPETPVGGKGKGGKGGRKQRG